MRQEIAVAKGRVDVELSRGKATRKKPAEYEEIGAVLGRRMLKIVSFAEMGLNAKEIRLGLIIEARENVPLDEINSILTTAITKGSLPKKGHSGKLEVPATREEQIDKVLRRLFAKKMLPEEKANMLHGSAEWDRVVESMGNIDKPLDIVKKLLMRGISLSDSMQIAKLEHTPTEDPIARFAQELAKEGIVGTDLSNHYQLCLIFDQNLIERPSSAHMVILETLIAARKGIRAKDLTILNKYKELRDRSFNEKSGGESKESEKLGMIEDFIRGKDDNLEYRTDGEGSLYRNGTNGERLLTVVTISDGGQPIFDNSVLSGQRDASRKKIAAEDKRKSTTVVRQEILPDISHPLDLKDEAEESEMAESNGLQKPHGNRVSHGGRHMTKGNEPFV